MPRDSVGKLEFNCASDGQYGLNGANFATIVMQGLSRTLGKNIYYTKLNVNEAANSTVLDVADDTGWLDNDVICVASTSRTYTECEKGTLAAAASTTQLTVDGFGGAGGGLLNAHLGTTSTPAMQAEIGLLTRNVKVTAVTAGVGTYLITANTTVNIDWVEFYEFSYASGSVCISLNPTTVPQDFQYCAFYNFEKGFYFSSSTTGSIIFSNNVCYNIIASGAGQANVNISAAGIYQTLENNVFMNFTVGSGIVYDNNGGNYQAITFNGNMISSCQSMGAFMGSSAATTYTTGVTWSNNSFHSCGSDGLKLKSYGVQGVITNLTCWRNSGAGLNFGDAGAATTGAKNLRLQGCSFWGNTTNIAQCPSDDSLIFHTCILGSDATFTTTTGIGSLSPSISPTLINCTFGSPVAHTTDLAVALGSFNGTVGRFINCSTIATITATTPKGRSFIQCHDYGATPSRYKNINAYGILSDQITGGQNAAWARSNSICGYLNPNSTSIPLEWEFYIPVTASTAFTYSFYHRITSNYNGTLTCTIYDSDDDYTELQSAASVTLTNDGAWHQYTSASLTPTNTGYCRILLKCLDGSTTGDIGIADMSWADALTTGTYNFTRWRDGMPEVSAITQTTTPVVPVFSGLVQLESTGSGTLRATWATASGTWTGYNVYVRQGASPNFSATYFKCKVDSATTEFIWRMDYDNTTFIDGTQAVYVGVRAENSGTEDANAVELNIIPTGTGTFIRPITEAFVV
jgi:hypothetical protein